MTLKFNRVHAVVKIHVRAKFELIKVQWFISYRAHREKNSLQRKQYSPSLPRGQ